MEIDYTFDYKHGIGTKPSQPVPPIKKTPDRPSPTTSKKISNPPASSTPKKSSDQPWEGGMYKVVFVLLLLLIFCPNR